MEEPTQGQRNPTGGSCQPGGSGKADPCDPKDIITKLTERSVELEQEKTRSEKQKQAVDADKTTIESKANTLSETEDEYKKEASNKEREQNEFRCYWESLNRVIEHSIRDHRRRLDDFIRAKEDELETCKEEVQAREKTRDRAEAELDTVTRDLESKTKAYEKVVGSLDAITSQLTVLSTLKTLITQENAANHLCTVYFLLREFDTEWHKLDIQSTSEFHTSLYKTFCEWVEAMQKVRDAQWNLDQSKAELSAKGTTCANKENNFRTDMIAQLNKWDCSPCTDKPTTQSC